MESVCLNQADSSLGSQSLLIRQVARYEISLSPILVMQLAGLVILVRQIPCYVVSQFHSIVSHEAPQLVNLSAISSVTPLSCISVYQFSPSSSQSAFSFHQALHSDIILPVHQAIHSASQPFIKLSVSQSSYPFIKLSRHSNTQTQFFYKSVKPSTLPVTQFSSLLIHPSIFLSILHALTPLSHTDTEPAMSLSTNQLIHSPSQSGPSS